MLKRGLVLGSLIAGAFLLPAVAGAGVVSGVCSNCHTMHASLGGVASTANGTLLAAGADCAGCHAIAGVENQDTGKPNVGTLAPQVDGAAATVAGFVNNAGYFEIGAGADARQHNVVGVSPQDATLLLTRPGNPVNMASQLTCGNCHGGSGIHHGSGSTTSYRSLTPVVTTTLGSQPATGVGAYGALGDSANLTSGERRLLAYDSTSMNNFCAACHPSFHGSANQDGATLNDGTWIRHPTGVSTTTAGAAGPSIVSWVASSDSNAVPVGTTGAAANEVMCISCHVAHGGPFNDLLSFRYDATANLAGDATVSPGCETCHSYTAAGM